MDIRYLSFLFSVLLSLVIGNFSYSQTGCLGADPFCTGTNYSFPNSTNVADLGAVDCLGSTPNPAWYYMEIDQNGPMGFTISQSSTSGVGLDVDFALWGPYSSLQAGCSNPFPSGAPIDCSYSTADVENVNIPNAQIGQTYILLITNFSNSAGTINFSQTSGSGSADCSFTCGVNLTANPGICSNNTYTLSGNLTVTAGPGISVPNSGTVTISSSCGGSQTFNAPFTNIPYSFTGLPANGAACTVTATFSNFSNCNTIQTYPAPSNCNPTCSITSVSANPSTSSNGQYSVSGAITFTNPPSSGTLTLTGSCGGTQTFNAPFSSPLNYNLTGLSANGSNCTVTATFSANSSCTNTINYVAPTSNSSCSFTGFTGNLSSCNAIDNSYTITGSISYTSPPSSGTLTLTNSCGGSQTFNAPFGTSQNFSLIGNANGASCTITASFSADASCSATLDYTAPPTCGCPAEVGTYNTSINGNSNSMNMICFGDTLDITSNNNWTPPSEIIGATDPNSANYDPNAPIYDPGIAWLIYSCPPSVALTPSQSATSGLGISDDPCLLGVVGNTPDIFDINDLTLINSFPAGTFTNNTVYLVPLTMYSLQDGIYSYIVQPALDCYELGTPIAVQYLPQITFTQTQNCANGTVSATISGGAALLNGTNFSVVNGSITPNTAQAVNTTTNNGGTIVIGNLQTGPYSFQVQDVNGCPITISGNFTGSQNVSLSYNDNLLCLNDPNPLPIVTGTQGGTFSSGSGLSLNSTSGAVDLLNSIPGVYAITYTSPGPLCPGTDTYTITIEDYPIVDGGPDLTVCLGNQITLTASGANSYVWNSGLVDGLPYLPGVGETQFIVVGSTSAGCTGTDTVLVTVMEDCVEEEDEIFWVPNTFTPDDDEHNQSFHVVFYSGFDPFSFELTLYNRWGELIWESHDVTAGWDGTYNNGMKVPDGVYTWKIKFKSLQNDKKQTATGHVTILR